MYIVTIFDLTATKENPIAPETKIVSSSKIADFVNEVVDENHSITIAVIDTY